MAQTFDDLEVIVADDGSTDGSADLVEEFGDKGVRLIRIEHSGLPAVARYAALTLASGQLVAFLDSDDLWLSTNFERQVGVLGQQPAIGLVCSNARVVNAAGDEVRSLYLRHDEGKCGVFSMSFSG